jgi:hypothetical protein
MAMDRQPTVALRVLSRGVKTVGGGHQGLNQFLGCGHGRCASEWGHQQLIMASDKHPLFEARHRLAGVLLLAAAWMGGSGVMAADTLPYEPPCPVLASPGGQSLLQPMRLEPQQVKAKNAMGCLSPSDAIYGPDGCPQRFCGSNSGVFKLP